MTTAAVVGLGCRDRGDDAVGPAVADHVAALALPGVVVASHPDPAGLLEAWTDADLVVVVDAIRSGRRPGTVRVLRAPPGELPPWAGAGSTHTFDLAAAVELARALRRLPRDLVIVGVEAGQLGPGEPLSPPVAAAVEPAARAVAGVVAASRGGAGGSKRGGDGRRGLKAS